MRSIIGSLIAAAIIGLFGWIVLTASRVAALEADNASLKDNIAQIREDVAYIRQWLDNHSKLDNK